VGHGAGWVALALAAAASAPPAKLSLRLAARAQQPGELVLLTIQEPPGAGVPVVTAFGRERPVFAAGKGRWRALVGIDLEVAPGTYPITVDVPAYGGPLQASVALHVKAKTFPVRALQVDEAFVEPPAEVQERIAREAEELKAIFATMGPERLWADGFLAPVAQQANSRFGSRSVFNGQPRSPHTGADFPSPAGTPVRAPGAGRVVLARPLYFAGNAVLLDHGLGLFSLLAHLSAIDVKEGRDVARGEVVGRVGATGRVTGPHLHWAVRLGEARVDPLSLLFVLGRK
jgi:murein DD-endopeptidase MepM/ murein hydrolase activator NlpD